MYDDMVNGPVLSKVTIDLSFRVQWPNILFHRILLQPLALTFFTFTSLIFPELSGR